MGDTYTNCTAGKYYGFSNHSNFNIDQTIQVQWGAWDNGSTPLNIYLSRPGGSLVQPIILNAGFHRDNSVYRIYNSSSTCELNQVNVTIPNDIGVATNASETFLFGIFNASLSLGVDGNPLSGFMTWSPDFTVWNNITTTTSAGPSATTAPPKIAGTVLPASASTTSALTLIQPTASSTPVPDSSGMSSGTKAGIAIGAVAGFILIGVLFAGIWLRNRRKQRSLPDIVRGSSPQPPGTGQTLVNSYDHMHELSMEQQMILKEQEYKVSQNPVIYEMSSSRQAYEIAA